MRCSLKTIPLEELRKQIKELVVESGAGCWVWNGDKFEGSPIFKRTTAARAAYQAFVKPLPRGKYLYRLCNQPLCVYPGHFRVGSNGKRNRSRSASA